MSDFALFDLLEKHNLHISSAESLTGGAFMSYLTSISGASKVLKGGMVTYLNEVKEKLGVSSETLDKYGAVSKECAYEMAMSASKFFETEVAISFTGNAGPTVLENKAVGLVYIGICINSKCETYELHLSGSRNEIREECCKRGLELLIENLKSL